MNLSSLYLRVKGRANQHIQNIVADAPNADANVRYQL